MSQFLQDVLEGLTSENKRLDSKYFYDAAGDELFRQIMACPEYYPTKCEMEIFTCQTNELAACFAQIAKEFDIVELGPGDASKSIHLLQALFNQNIKFTYFPVDISQNVINLLNTELRQKMPSLQFHGLNGDYFSMLEKAKTLSDKIKVVLFLGGNIGNIEIEKAPDFCRFLRGHLVAGDLVLIGFDLKKNPQLILDAYNDKAGYTRNFNLNLLTRINRELDADFNVEHFQHYPTYDPATGTCKSYLISTQEQQVHLCKETIHFAEGETVHTEISQKYTVAQTEALAKESGFIPVKYFYDSRKWFLDAVWRCV